MSLREPDAIGWLGDDRLVTANEGDYEGGSRGFTLFDTAGKVLWDSGNLLEHLAMSHGHYPVKRAKSKGVEPEGVEIATFGDQRLIFVNAERGNFVAVVRRQGSGQCARVRCSSCPTGVGPEGLIAIPAATCSPSPTRPTSPTTISAPPSTSTAAVRRPGLPDDRLGARPGDRRADRLGRALGPGRRSRRRRHVLYAVSDSYYGRSRIYTIDASATPARITALRRAEEGRQRRSPTTWRAWR